MGGAVALALLSALLTAISTVAQQRAAYALADTTSGHVGLIRALTRRPLWWAGLVGDTGGYVCQAAALGLGSLLLVQPLLVTALLFALPLGAHYANRRVSRSDWGAAVLLTASLAVFVVASNPKRGTAHGSIDDWVIAIAVLAPITVACVVGATTSMGARRAVLLAIAVGIVGTTLQQSAFSAGALQASLPTMTVLEPAVATVLAITLLGEQLDTDEAGWVLIGAAVACMLAGTVALARSSARVEAAVATQPEPEPV